MKEVQKIGGQKALNALNALSVRHLRNVSGHRPKKKKKVTKEIKKKGEATKISCPIPHEKLRHRSERRRLKGRFSFRSVDFFTNILLIELYLPPILMGMGESQLPSHPKSHPKSHHPIPFVIIPFQSQIPSQSQIPFKSHLNPVIVEGQKYHHSNRLVETSRMVVFPFFYDH